MGGGIEISTMIWWISWAQSPLALRVPLTIPPVEYWITGTRWSDGAITICSIVEAESEDEAKELIQQYWPEASEWRFCVQRSPGWRPDPCRFPPLGIDSKIGEKV